MERESWSVCLVAGAYLHHRVWVIAGAVGWEVGRFAVDLEELERLVAFDQEDLLEEPALPGALVEGGGEDGHQVKERGRGRWVEAVRYPIGADAERQALAALLAV